VPSSHANAPPGKSRVERSSGFAPRSPPHGGWALGDVVPAYWAEIGPTCDVTPSVRGFPVEIRLGGRPPRRGQTFWILILSYL